MLTQLMTMTVTHKFPSLGIPVDQHHVKLFPQRRRSHKLDRDIEVLGLGMRVEADERQVSVGVLLLPWSRPGGGKRQEDDSQEDDNGGELHRSVSFLHFHNWTKDWTCGRGSYNPRY